MKKKHFLLTIVIALFLFSLSIGSVAAQNGTGKIDGYIKTGDGEPLDDFEVKLETSNSTEINFHEIKSTYTNKSGFFNFKDLNTSKLYKIRIDYKNETFYSRSNLMDMGGQVPDSMKGILSFMASPSNEITQNITVYHGTSDKGNLIAQNQHLVLQKTNSNLSILKVIILNNTGTESFYGNLTKLSLFNDEGKELINDSEKVGIGPNETKMLTSRYNIPFKNNFELKGKTSLYSLNYGIYLNANTLEVSSYSNNLLERGTETIGEQTYQLYEAEIDNGGFSSGETFEFTLIDANDAPPVEEPKEDSGLLIPLAIASIVVLVVLVFIRREKISFLNTDSNSSKNRSEAGKMSDEKSLNKRKESLLGKINKLDKRYEDGEISEEEYEILNEKYREELRDVLEKIEET